MDRSLGECEIVADKPKNYACEKDRLGEKNLEDAKSAKNCMAKVNWVNILFKNPLNRNGLCAEVKGPKIDECEVGLETNMIRVEEEEPNLAKRVCDEVENLNPTLSKNELVSSKSVQ
ncbi:hypothetical protein V6N12_069230 [Hibiscus sabdariffa]|uniref:Uncharacterized protein n=1 Tax=Hibiscus sabdariffa TaxID=183260 RepID=A0ABR2FDM0_9ROSI